jgi:hypothetical protein
MTVSTKKLVQIALATTMAVGALFANENFRQIATGAFVSQAAAWIGRPLTPFSYAGVARRTTRRAYGYGVGGVYGAPVYGAPVYGAGCYVVAGPYGGLITRCP